MCSANACGTRVASSGITYVSQENSTFMTYFLYSPNPSEYMDGSFSVARTAYHIEKRTTIKADGKAHKVGIAQLDFPSKPMRYAIPSLSKFVFLQVRLLNRNCPESLFDLVFVQHVFLIDIWHK